MATMLAASKADFTRVATFARSGVSPRFGGFGACLAALLIMARGLGGATSRGNEARFRTGNRRTRSGGPKRDFRNRDAHSGHRTGSRPAGTRLKRLIRFQPRPDLKNSIEWASDLDRRVCHHGRRDLERHGLGLYRI